ncbi:hypothetical protein EHS13_02340 [Paenibacillus psychroresistens]|uniref:Uncharacterized protein n=2 Tax=Paenibacillus psychroresistens TaxID=1778678 RepID=A0A6B8REN9_9BACL|nr:hypothetical protein EHS13_02340 [Paenibacillus psychroresistens]
MSMLCLIVVICTAATTQKDPLSITQKLAIKDDRGENWLLKNTKEYKMKWSLSDESPYQHYELSQGPNGLLFAQNFKELIAINADTGETVWKIPSKYQFGVVPTIGSDGSYYKFSLENAKQLSPNILQTDISRFGVDGTKTVFSSIKLHVTKERSIHSSQQVGDSAGNFIVLTDKGLLSIKPDGSTNWLLDKIKTSKASFNSKTTDGLFSDSKGNIFMIFSNTIVSLSTKGKVNWAREYSFTKDYNHVVTSITTGGFLLQQTSAKDYSSYESKLYDMTAKGLILVKEASIINKNLGNSDQNGGYYNLIDNTNTVIDRDYITGKTKWSYSLSKYERQAGLSLYSGDLRVDPQGNVFFGNNAGTVYSLDNKGKPRFILAMKNAIIANANILPINGNSVILTVNSHIVCIEKIVK